MMIHRAQGSLLGQLCGDALGSQVEFQSPKQILRRYPDGIRTIADGGTWQTLAGQPTDDSEMALLLARSLIANKDFDQHDVLQAYRFWLSSDPFDCGNTIGAALRGHLNPASQANGAMMRISPLGIFGANLPLERVADWAKQDAALTHPNPICLQINALFTMAISEAVRHESQPEALYQNILNWAQEHDVAKPVLETIKRAASKLPEDFLEHQGWVLIAFQNVLYQLLHAPDFETALVDTVMHGGDTDTNAAICGALLGAVYGLEAIPRQWVDCVLHCRPQKGMPGVKQPRPECFWPVDALSIAEQLLGSAPASAV